jgi:hypothetical protein
VLLDQVKVPKTHLIPGYKGYDRPTADGPNDLLPAALVV